MIKKAPKAKANPKAKEKAKEKARAEIKAKIQAKIQARIQAKEKPKAKPNPTATETAPGLRFGLGAGLATAWKKWTGADPGQTFKLRLVDGLKDCPSEVVMLGRITKLITKSGQIETFRSGPYMVTDSAMKKVWLVDQRDRSFALNLKGGIIIYLAKKPKFGDRQAIEYVHLFQGAIRAEMHGQVGRLEGPYKLTPAGIEG